MDQNVKITLSAQDKTGAAFKSAANNVKALQTSAASLVSGLGGLGAGLSIAGIATFAKSAIDSLDALNDLRDATGASIENISALEDTAARTGTSMDTVSQSVVKLNQLLNAATPDSEQARAIEAIGLKVADLQKLDPAQSLLEVSKALANFADDGAKGRVGLVLFDKAYRNLAPLLKDLAEKGKLIPTVTSEMTEEAEKFNNQLAQLEKNIRDVSRSLAGDMVRSIFAAADAYKKSGLIGGVDAFFSGDEQHKNNVKLVQQTERLLVLQNEIDRLKTSGSALDAALLRKKQEDLKKLQVEIKTTQDYQQILAGDPAPASTAKPSVVFDGKPSKSPKTGAAAKDPYAEAKRYIDSLQKQIEKTQELTAVQQLGMDINAGRIGRMTTEQRQESVDLALKLDSIKDEIDLQKELAKVAVQASADQEEFFRNVMASDDSKQGRIKSLLDATPTGKSASLQVDLTLLQTELENGRIKADLYSEAVVELFGLNNEKSKEAKTLADDLGLSFSSAFEDAIVGGKAFSDVLQGVEQDILRIVTRKLVTEPLGNAISGAVSGSNIGGFVTNLLKFDGGGYTGAAPRTGGLDGKGGFFAMLHPQESVVDHARGQSAGNSVIVNISQQFAQGTSRSTVLQAAADASRQLQYAGRNL